MLGRLVQAADFQRLLASPMQSRSAHFAVHHLPACPTPVSRGKVHSSSTDLSTESFSSRNESVDNKPDRCWLGCVVPKRHARRAVTRNLLRRQMRAVMDERQAQLPPGLWLVRLRSTYTREQFPAAASLALRQAVRAELQQLLGRVSNAQRRQAG